MVKLVGLNKINTCVFISGTGSNLKNLIKFSSIKKTPIKISIVISNSAKAKGLTYAKSNRIKTKIFTFKAKLKDERNILRILKKYKIKLICLAGFMKVLSKNFINSFDGKILNIHPSLLPKYKGLNTHERVLKNKEKYSGCTVHFVSPELDSGKIIIQKKVKISKNETPKKLAKKFLLKNTNFTPRQY